MEAPIFINYFLSGRFPISYQGTKTVKSFPMAYREPGYLCEVSPICIYDADTKNRQTASGELTARPRPGRWDGGIESNAALHFPWDIANIYCLRCCKFW